LASSVVLEARGLTRRFTGVLALSGVDFRLFAGEVHALMGQNGAGKSTLIKVLTGVHAPDAGELRLGGELIHPGSPRRRSSPSSGACTPVSSLTRVDLPAPFWPISAWTSPG